MLSRKQIDERLATLAVVDSVYFGANMCVNREREALETAQKLWEWVANADHGQDAVELLKARARLRGEGE